MEGTTNVVSQLLLPVVRRRSLTIQDINKLNLEDLPTEMCSKMAEESVTTNSTPTSGLSYRSSTASSDGTWQQIAKTHEGVKLDIDDFTETSASTLEEIWQTFQIRDPQVLAPRLESSNVGAENCERQCLAISRDNKRSFKRTNVRVFEDIWRTFQIREPQVLTPRCKKVL
eukprot:TRINITY_DN341_c0_g1_i1.p1 TRINITY_DN341_c0_g1~~TRINITY_DN341_c0_g1_i1.p1  ORF type:complete len:171 (+),score=26.06 TRINITY_DN341_c0_g1_i1:151-663(+)